MKDYKVVHFSDEFTMEDITEAMSYQDDILYYTRYITEKNEFHIVKYKNGEFTITPFISQLLNFYKNDKNKKKLLGESMVKGNNTFAIITNINDELLIQVKQDLNILLKK